MVVSWRGDGVPDLLPALRAARLGREVEIATHGDTHRNLHDIEVESPGHVRYDIRDSKSKILSAVGVDPTVLILPYGQMVDDARLLHKEGIKWAVGISGGQYIDLTDRLIYVGRQAPAGSPPETLEAMLRPFVSEQ
jgi:peptidoglycan/xylan/chitin deacetylase (PgdA/CDA1 family)